MSEVESEAKRIAEEYAESTKLNRGDDQARCLLVQMIVSFIERRRVQDAAEIESLRIRLSEKEKAVRELSEHLVDRVLAVMDEKLSRTKAQAATAKGILDSLFVAVSEQQYTLNSLGWRTDTAGGNWSNSGARSYQYEAIQVLLRRAQEFLQNLATGAEEVSRG